MAKAISNDPGKRRSQLGFSLVEVVVSMAILTMGLVSLLGVFGIAMASTQGSQQDMIAKQLANEALESIVTARNTSQLSWVAIQNASDGGLFLNDFQPIYKPGADGIAGTADDSSSGGYQTLIAPGQDGIYGTADDVPTPLSNFQRKVEILPVVDNNGQIISSLRSVNITIQYYTTSRKAAKTYVLNSFISQYR